MHACRCVFCGTSRTLSRAQVVLAAGTDIDCGTFLPNNLNKALNGAVPQADADRALTDLFMVQCASAFLTRQRCSPTRASR